MGSGTKDKGKIDMGNYVTKEAERNAMTWCIANKIFISPKAKSTTEWYVNININGRNNFSPESYEKITIWRQVYKFYLYYYNKYNNIITPEVKEIKKVIKVKQQLNDKQLF